MMRSSARRDRVSRNRHAAATAAPSRKRWLQTNPRSRAVPVVMLVASALALTIVIVNYWSLSSSMGRPPATRSLLKPFPPLMPSKTRPPRPALPPRPDNRPTLWVTVLDRSSTGRVGARIFKRHMVTKYKYGKIEWERMGILATPEAPRELVSWAQKLGVSTFNVSELSCATARNTGQPGFGHRMTQAYAWCMEKYRQVIFMDVRTIVMRDINGLIAGCEGGDGAGLCAVAAGEDLPYYKVDPGVMVAFPSKDRCEDLARIASMPRFRTASCAKALFNTYFTYKERMVIDPRFNTITFETKTSHKLEDAFVIQYAPSHVPSMNRADFRILLRKVDRVVDLFSAEMKNRMPWHVLYATLVTPPTQEDEAVIASSAALMKHFVSQFALGKIPWKIRQSFTQRTPTQKFVSGSWQKVDTPSRCLPFFARILVAHVSSTDLQNYSSLA